MTPSILEADVRTAFILVLDLLKPTVFWDIGANIGFYSWFVRQHPAIRRVIMFEPDGVNFSLITKTIRKNAIRDCEVMNLALADRTGEAVFLVDRASGATGSLQAVSQLEDKCSMQSAYHLGETTTCRTETVDRMIAEGTPPPGLMKIDVEGAEHLVLAGAERCIARHRPALIVETSNMDLSRKICDVGYALFRIDSGNLLFVPIWPGIDLLPFRRALSAEIDGTTSLGMR